MTGSKKYPSVLMLVRKSTRERLREIRKESRVPMVKILEYMVYWFSVDDWADKVFEAYHRKEE
jgi:hypothetical protein